MLSLDPQIFSLTEQTAANGYGVMLQGFKNKFHIFPLLKSCAVSGCIEILGIAIQYLETSVKKCFKVSIWKREFLFKWFLPEQFSLVFMKVNSVTPFLKIRHFRIRFVA